MRLFLLTVSLLTAASPLAAAAQYGRFGIDTAGMDRSVAPGDDFFAYVNGTWDKTTPIPADRAGYGVFYILDDLSRERTRGLIEAAAKAGPAGDADARRVGTYYATYMDEAALEAKGLAAFKPALDRIAAVATPADLARALAVDQRTGIPGPINFGVQQDPKAPDRYMIGIGQSGLGLPDRDYYLVDTPKFAETRTKYVAHIAAMFRLAGLADAEARAAAVFALEKAIAGVHWTRVDNRDPDKTYNLRTPASLAAEAPGFDWPAFLAATGAGGETRIDVAQPSAIAGTAALTRSTPIAVWRDYLVLRRLKARANVLPLAFQTENFAFSGTVLSGQPTIQPRWKRGVNAVNGAMGEAVGQLYVAKYFPADAKAKIDTLVANLRAAMGARIDTASWMSPATRA